MSSKPGVANALNNVTASKAGNARTSHKANDLNNATASKADSATKVTHANSRIAPKVVNATRIVSQDQGPRVGNARKVPDRGRNAVHVLKVGNHVRKGAQGRKANALKAVATTVTETGTATAATVVAVVTSPKVVAAMPHKHNNDQ